MCSCVSTDLCDPADLSLVCGAVAGSGQGTLLHWSPAVQGCVGGGAQVKGIMGVVVQLMGVCQGLLAGRQNLASLKESGVRS